MNLKSVCVLMALVWLFAAGVMACSAGAPTNQQSGQPAAAKGVTLGTPLPGTAPTKWVKEFSEFPPGTVSHVDVVYFHRTERCTACLNAENYTHETIESFFAEPVQRGMLSLQVLDVEKPENAALAMKFDAASSALYLSVLIQGTEYLCPNSDIWFYTTNKYLFVDTLKKKLTSLIGRS